MNEACLMRLIQEYREVRVIQPSRNLDKQYFDRGCYSNWAVDEILSRLIDEFDRLPSHITGRDPTPYFHIIEEFVFDMDYMAKTTTDYHKRFIFLVARDTGNGLLMFLRGETE